MDAQYGISFPSMPSHDIRIRPLEHTDAPSLAKIANDQSIAQWMRDTFPHPYAVANAERFFSKVLDDRSGWRRGGNITVDDAFPLFTPSEPTQKWDQAHPLLPTDFAVLLSNSPGKADVETFVGVIGFDFGTDTKRCTAELGYWLGREYWSKGYATAVVEAFAGRKDGWLWKTWPWLVRVEAEVFEGNVGSERILEKISGWTKDATLQKAVWKQGKAKDLSVWMCLK